MVHVYVLKNSENGKIYIGQTANLEKRLEYHNGIRKCRKKSYSSRNIGRGVWNVVYSECYEKRDKALKREKELKSSRGRSFIKSIIRP